MYQTIRLYGVQILQWQVPKSRQAEKWQAETLLYSLQEIPAIALSVQGL